MKLGTSVMFEPTSNCVLSYGLECMWMMAWLKCVCFMSSDENARKICLTLVIELIHIFEPHSSSNERKIYDDLESSQDVSNYLR